MDCPFRDLKSFFKYSNYSHRGKSSMNIKKTLCSLIVNTIMTSILIAPAHAKRKYLFTWDKGSGTTMPGWTWSNDVAYGHPGWTLNADGPFGGGKTFMWGYGPRSFEKGGNSTKSTAIIDNQSIAPGTQNGGSLKVIDEANTLHRPGWWIWYDGESLGSRGITNADTDRLSFYLKAEGIRGLPKTGAYNAFPEGNFHIGTYLCWNDGSPVYGQGDGCPYEGPGNQHYYHYLSIDPGGWIHVELDQHPQHKRDSFVPGNDPSFIEAGKHYYENLHQFYAIIKKDQDNKTYFNIDEICFYSTKDPTINIEPIQNVDSITSVWVGYFPRTGKWEISWSDQSFENSSGENRNDQTWSTFQIRWSTSPITNSNWDQAIPISAEYYAGPSYTGSSDLSIVRIITSWRATCWTQFKLPADIGTVSNKVYFAIKDISSAGAHAGSNWPYSHGDGHNAPSPYIHTIDYHLAKGIPLSIPIINYLKIN